MTEWQQEWACCAYGIAMLRLLLRFRQRQGRGGRGRTLVNSNIRKRLE